MAELKSSLVTSREKKFIDTIRELPEGDLKRTAEAFLLELSDCLTNPRCAEVQADGIPCGAVDADCEQCLELKSMVEQLRDRLKQSLV